MNNEQIKEAVEVVNQGKYEVTWNADSSAKYNAALEKLINLATDYLKIEGMPDSYPEEAIGEKSSLIDERKIWMKGYNLALHDCRLALVKKCEGFSTVFDKFLSEKDISMGINAKGQYGIKQMSVKEFKEDLLKSLKDHILGGGGR